VDLLPGYSGNACCATKYGFATLRSVSIARDRNHPVVQGRLPLLTEESLQANAELSPGITSFREVLEEWKIAARFR